ncbi:MAG TPA: threonine--tRNA ligase [Candidatus Saccharimonadales bacterium]|nr:threonine--tRNA ligase [Candidatus Saccharimonadales bacterium]
MAESQPELHAMRHSLAHIMATAITRQWPEVRLGVGPVVENGFYYDVDLGDKQLSEEDFAAIEAEMKKVIGENQPFERFTKPVDEAIAWAQEAHQPYKEELLNDLKRSGTTVAKELDAEELGIAAEGDSKVAEVSFYKNGDFTDLCRGPHVESTGKVGAFKLMRISGAYWRGKEGNPQMQRVYGVAFATEKDLRTYLNMLEEAKKRDHRKLGQELDLFVFSDLVGSGLPLFTPRGTVLRNELTKFAESLRAVSGFQRVSIPHITKTDLYKVSGHWDKFGEELFLVKSQETSDAFALKPMNCPHHNQIYAARPRSYRDLPIKYFETTTVYRDEKTGELGGLSRVRSISQDDSHAYCRPEQVGDVVGDLVGDVQTLYSTLGMSLRARLSFRDSSDKYLGEPQLWDEAQSTIRSLAEKNSLDYFEAEGEAAFYGPKIDFMATDALGREHQVATIQLDFVQPERFSLEYVAEDGSTKRPVMVHCALLGSIERFLSVYIEHTAGKFPVWVAPEQIRLITVNQEDETVGFARKIEEQAIALGLRIVVDNDNESVGKKIRNAELMKVPYTVVIGQKEIETGELVPRIRKDIEVNENHDSHTFDEFLKTVANEAKSRVSKTSL